MKTKLLLFCLSLFVLAVSVTGCGGKEPAKKAAAPVTELRVTYVKAPLNIPSIVDKNLSLIHIFPINRPKKRLNYSRIAASLWWKKFRTAFYRRPGNM